MKHRRGIDLFEGIDATKPTRETFALKHVQEWYVLYGKCNGCGHAGYIDRWELGRDFGLSRPFVEMMPMLRCTRCGNREDNSFQIAKKPR